MKMCNRAGSLGTSLIVGLVLAVLPLAAQSTADRVGETRSDLDYYSVDDQGVALLGYSPVSYLQRGKAEKGDPAISLSYRGITYHFTDAEQRELFKKNPEKYEPLHGGWCSLMMGGSGNRVAANPEAFVNFDGNILLFFSGDWDGNHVNGIDNWNKRKNQPSVVKKAEKNWTAVRAGKKKSRVFTPPPGK